MSPSVTKCKVDGWEHTRITTRNANIPPQWLYNTMRSQQEEGMVKIHEYWKCTRDMYQMYMVKFAKYMKYMCTVPKQLAFQQLNTQWVDDCEKYCNLLQSSPSQQGCRRNTHKHIVCPAQTASTHISAHWHLLLLWLWHSCERYSFEKTEMCRWPLKTNFVVAFMLFQIITENNPWRIIFRHASVSSTYPVVGRKFWIF